MIVEVLIHSDPELVVDVQCNDVEEELVGAPHLLVESLPLAVAPDCSLDEYHVLYTQSLRAAPEDSLV